MTHDQLRELVAVYALDATDEAEAAAVEEHLSGCPRCRAELEAYREVAAAIGDQGGAARPEIWDRIAGQLAEAPPPLRLPTRTRRPRPRATPRLTAAVAAAAAIVIAVLGWDVAHLNSRVDHLQAVAGGTARAARVAADAPGSKRVQLHSTSGALTADVVVRPGGQAYLLSSTLPTLPDGRIYQLWGLSRNRPVSLGLLGARAAPAGFRLDSHVTQLMITAEPAGGVPAPTGPVLVQGAVTTGG